MYAYTCVLPTRIVGAFDLGCPLVWLFTQDTVPKICLQNLVKRCQNLCTWISISNQKKQPNICETINVWQFHLHCIGTQKASALNDCNYNRDIFHDLINLKFSKFPKFFLWSLIWHLHKSCHWKSHDLENSAPKLCCRISGNLNLCWLKISTVALYWLTFWKISERAKQTNFLTHTTYCKLARYNTRSPWALAFLRTKLAICQSFRSWTYSPFPPQGLKLSLFFTLWGAVS